MTGKRQTVILSGFVMKVFPTKMVKNGVYINK